MKQPRLRGQWQRLSKREFEMIVRYETQRYFYKRYLTNCRVQRLLERIPERRLIDDITHLFFQSFSEIISGLAIPAATPISATWYYTHKLIKGIYIDGKARKKKDDDDEDITQKFRVITLRFLQYYMFLSPRISLITNYVTDKNIFGPEVLQAACNMKHMHTDEYIDEHTNKRYFPMNMSPMIRMIGQELGSSFKSDKRNIWEPAQTKEDDGSIRIGDSSSWVF
jgi:hypothetical protein